MQLAGFVYKIVVRLWCLIWASYIHGSGKSHFWAVLEHVEGAVCCCLTTLSIWARLSDCIVKSHWSGLTRRWVLSLQHKLRGWRRRLRRIAAADKMRKRRRSSASSAALRDGRNLKCKIGLFCDQLGFSAGLWQSAPALSSPSWQGNRPGA